MIPSFSHAESSKGEIFQASYNKANRPLHPSGKKTLYNVFSAIAFPVGGVRLTKHGLHLLAGRAAILPAQRLNEEDMINTRKRFQRGLKHYYGAKDVLFKTPDGTALEALYLKGYKEGQELSENAPTIIYFNGNGEFKDLNTFTASLYKKDAALRVFLEGGYNVFFFNYRGVDQSEGKATCQRLLLDGESAYQYVHTHLQVPEGDITLFGHSLGGGVATTIAQMHPKVQLCNDRSFSSLSQEVKQLVGQKSHPALGYSAAKVVSWIGWEFQTQKKWAEIEGKTLVVFSPEDEMILEKASLAHRMQNAKEPQDLARTTQSLEWLESGGVAMLKMAHVPRQSPHNRALTEAEAQEIAAYFRKEEG
ncbi:MAG: bem46 [Chlamydiales bacterium]|jgi:acetyl esterase/lipase|nr:bem46 [Chlamydiales bacterium]